MSYEEVIIILNQTVELINTGNYDEAERLVNQILAELDNPDSFPSCEGHDGVLIRAMALVTLTDVARLRGNYEQSLTLAHAALDIAEDYNLTTIKPRAWNICGLVYYHLGNYDKALEYYNKALVVQQELGKKSGAALVTGNIGGVYASLGDYDKALEYYKKALTEHEELGEKSGAARVTGNIGGVYSNIGNYDKALKYYKKALSEHEVLGEKSGAARVTGNIGNVYLELGNYNKALQYLNIALEVHEELGEKSGAALVTGNIGNLYRTLGNYDKALQYYNKVLPLYDELDEKSGVARVTGNIGIVYNSLGDYDKALEYFNKALAVHEELGEKSGEANITGNIGSVYHSLGNYDNALEYFNEALAVFEELGEKSGTAGTTGNIGLVYNSLGNYDKALGYYNKALAVFDELGQKSGAAIFTGNIGVLYADKKNEFYDAVKAEEILLNAVRLSTEVGAKAHLFEWHKTLADLYENEGRLADAFLQFKKYHDIEKEVLSEEATKQALIMDNRRKVEESERDRQVKLARFQEQEKILHNILPSQIANRMVSGEKTIADTYQNVSVFFSDIVDFTKLSQQVSAVELVGLLNGLFSQFDQLARKHGLEKIKTIGDAYMAVCGAPIPMENHAERTALFALDVAEMMNNYHTDSVGKISVRIGLHSGSVVAGIIGESKFAYDMWGDAVNTASRMESHGEADKIHVSEEFKHAVETLHATSLQFIRRGEMDIKGKGMMKTYFLQKANT